ncbi:MAG TPA: hypothetical protein VGL45_11045, partial [Bradyrhizobium sp.]
MSISARKEKIISSLALRKYRIFASRVQGQEMHLIDNESPELRLQNDGVIGALARPPIAGDDRLSKPVPSSINNEHLDALEAQSIYIFREAFARLKKLALLWSLGKDSNVMIWLARKAFFGRVPFPALHVDTGK